MLGGEDGNSSPVLSMDIVVRFPYRSLSCGKKCFQCPTNCVNLREVFLHYAVFEDFNDFSKVRV